MKTSSISLACWVCLALLLHLLHKYYLCFQGRLSETNSWLNASVNQATPLELNLVYSSLNIKMKQSSIRIDPQWPAIFPVNTEATVCSHKMIEGSRELPRCHQHRFCGRRQAGKQASSPRRSAGDPTGGSWSRGAFPARGRVIHGRSRGAAAAEPSSQLQFSTPLIPHLVI